MKSLLGKFEVTILCGIYFLAMASFIYMDQIPLLAFPIGLIAIYAAIFYPEKTFIALFFFVPLSVNLEEWSDTFGLFIPTEPMLFGLMLLVIWRSFLRKSDKINESSYFLRNQPILWTLAAYLFVVFVASVFSVSPMVSFKALLAKLWYVVPIFTIGFHAFKNPKNIRTALWLFLIGLSIVIIYTLIHHSMYAFGEKESHWVMSPFFKDHTVYGATVAFAVPIAIGLYFSKKHDLLMQILILLVILIQLLGLYFSYTRAAWLGIIGAVGVWFLIQYRIKFKYLFFVGLAISIFVAFNWNRITYRMSKNKMEHTTENFSDRLESASNISSDASNLERINRWDCAIQMFQAKPWTGFGPGTYAFEYAPFQKPENKTIISTNFANGGNAHSEFLLALSEMGIFGLLTFVAFVASIFYTCITLYYRIKDREIRIITLALILAEATYFIHSFINNFLDQDKIAMPVYAGLAMFLAISYQLKKQKQIQKVPN